MYVQEREAIYKTKPLNPCEKLAEGGLVLSLDPMHCKGKGVVTFDRFLVYADSAIM